MHVAISFTNFGPYHLARLRALGEALRQRGGRLTAYETAGRERKYPWERAKHGEPFEWVTLFDGQALEDLGSGACRAAVTERLDGNQPDVVAVVGYSRPESMAALGWACRNRKLRVLMSESQAIDRPRVWWKEAIKRRRVSRFHAALVGGPRHADYLVALGMERSRIVMGYNAVDHEGLAVRAEAARRDSGSRKGLPERPYFLAINRFVPEKNLVRLVQAYAEYRGRVRAPWDLVLCGDGEERGAIEREIRGRCLQGVVHCPGFLQEAALVPWLAHAGGFVHPSRMEPWGLVVNEAAACRVPLLVSDRAGCVETLVPSEGAQTGRRFDPDRINELVDAMGWLSSLGEDARVALGERARANAEGWGPGRFAAGTLEAIARGEVARRRGGLASTMSGTGDGHES